MALTRPTSAQINSAIEVVTDPLSLFNNKSTQANIDVGFILNRDGGTNSNIALVWQETDKQFAIGLTTATGATNANISFISYANVKLGNLITDGYINTSGNILAKTANVGQIGVVNNLVVGQQAYVGELYATTRAGDEGGQLNLANAVTNTTLVGNIVIDVFQNKLRIFEGDGTNRGGYFDLSGLTANVGTNLAAGGGGGTPGGGQGQIQFNSSSTFAGAASLYYFGANGAIVANAGIASTSTATGTMQITGGIGVSGTVFAGQLNTSGNVLATAGLFNALTVNGLINASGNILSTGASVFGNVALGSLATPGALNTISGNVSIYGVSSMLNIIGNIVVNNTAIASSNVTGAIRTTGGIGVGGNLYIGQRVGFVWGANNVSSVYQVFNNSTNSLDTVFG